MNLNVEVLEAAERDLLDAVRWYEENASRGAEVEAAVEALVDRLVSVPGSSSPVAGVVVARGELRRALVPGFPYWLVFLVLDQRLVIVALAHQSREPSFWVSRL
jgi:plasmid stabilization system protein ParE